MWHLPAQYLHSFNAADVGYVDCARISTEEKVEIMSVEAELSGVSVGRY